VVGLVDSRLKGLVKDLHQTLDAHTRILIDPQGPYSENERCSVFVISIPLQKAFISERDQLSMAQAYISFDTRLRETIEIGGWLNHSSKYEVIAGFEGLHQSVRERYTEQYYYNKQLCSDKSAHDLFSIFV
jgi:hypothetical protein